MVTANAIGDSLQNSLNKIMIAPSQYVTVVKLLKVTVYQEAIAALQFRINYTLRCY